MAQRIRPALHALAMAAVVAAGVLTPAVAGAGGPPPSSIGLRAAAAYAGTPTRVVAQLIGGGAPVAGARVRLERLRDGAWALLAVLITDDHGRVERSVRLDREPAANRLRVRYAGDVRQAAAVASIALPLRRRTTRLSLTGPPSVVDEQSVRLTAQWRTRSGLAVSGPVRLYRRVAGSAWTLVSRVRTDAHGRAAWTVTPREDTRWRAESPRLSWATHASSHTLALDNLPPGEPVRLPRHAPSPRLVLPPQPHATGRGAHAVITRIPDGVWRDMRGVTWHPGCPVGRSGLRLIRVDYWDYDGYRRRGEVVAATGAAHQIAGALSEMYDRELPIRSMYRVDRFGYSRKLGGGNDYRSMAAGNTSAFNCRDVVNRPGVRSPHAYGRALDVNTWENPYASATGLVPDAWWQSRSHPRVAWRSRDHLVVRLMARHGLRWTYGLGDTQHFDAIFGDGKVLATPGCGPTACE